MGKDQMHPDWSAAIAKITPQIVKVETAHGHGTGFFCYGDDAGLRTVATAYHVIEDALGQPVTIHSGTLSIRFGHPPDRPIMVGHFDGRDAALLILPYAAEFPKTTVPLLEKGKMLVPGTEIGWLGYPRIAHGLCFFSGRISAVYDKQFLVDGTAIHGVSGGPAFCFCPEGLRIVGSITAYRPNAVEKGLFPGLSVITDISAHRDIAVS